MVGAAPNELDVFGFESEDWFGLLQSASAPGRLGSIAGYELIEEAGRGGQGVVFRARHPEQGVVALKHMGMGRLCKASSLDRLRAEFEALRSLAHPNIVRARAFEVADDEPIVVMDWVDGIDLIAWCEGRTEGEIRRVFAQLCDAVAHAHRKGIAHRDLKPSNVLVDAGGRIRLLDFGISERGVGSDGRQDDLRAIQRMFAEACTELPRGRDMARQVGTPVADASELAMRIRASGSSRRRPRPRLLSISGGFLLLALLAIAMPRPQTVPADPLPELTIDLSAAPVEPEPAPKISEVEIGARFRTLTRAANGDPEKLRAMLEEHIRTLRPLREGEERAVRRVIRLEEPNQSTGSTLAMPR